MLERLAKHLVPWLVFRRFKRNSPTSDKFFVIVSQREPFRLVPPLDAEGGEKHGPTRLYSAPEAASSVTCLNRSQSLNLPASAKLFWLCSSGESSSNILRYSPTFGEYEFCELRVHRILGRSAQPRVPAWR